MGKREQVASTSKNHEQAPQAAAFVKAMREAFGADQVKVLYVREGEFELGERDGHDDTN